MPVWREIWISLAAYGITAAAAGVVVIPLCLVAARGRLLPLQRQRRRRWSGGEVLLAFLLFVFMPGVAIDLLDQLGFYQVLFVRPPSRLREDLWAAPLGTLLTLAFLFWLLFSASKTRPANLGLTRARWPQNLLLGYGSYLVLTPLVLASFSLVSIILSDVLNTPPQVHPLTELSRERLTRLEWGLLFFRASVAAVILEELVFRGVLQGWLPRASRLGQGAVIAITLYSGIEGSITPFLANHQQIAESAATTVGFLASPGGFGPLAAACALVDTSPSWQTAIGPFAFAAVLAAVYALMLRRRQSNPAQVAIFGSAMVWAVFHSNVWPTPIPLFLLGLALGWLAYRTQSLVAGMVVHALFNTVACISLVLTSGS